MAKIAADTKFEDWTPPWKEGEIDEDKVARLLFNALQSETSATAELKTVKKENGDLTDANEVFKAASDESAKNHDDATKKAVAEVTVKLEKERDQARDELATANRTTDLLQVRVKYPKIDEDDIERLKGDDLEGLLEDAGKFAEKHGLIEGEGEEEEVVEKENPGRRQPRLKTPGDPKIGEGAETSVEKYLTERAAQSAWVS